MKLTRYRIIWAPQAVVILMFLIAFKHPYLKYTFTTPNEYHQNNLLHVLCFAAFAYLAVHAYLQKKLDWAWGFAVTAIIYNPISPLDFSRRLWDGVYLVTIGLAVVSIKALARPR